MVSAMSRAQIRTTELLTGSERLEPAMSTMSASAKDSVHRQARMVSAVMNKFAVCPIFPSMFSDLQNYPRKQYVIRRGRQYSQSLSDDLQGSSNTSDSRDQVVGPDRYKYFHTSPVIPASVPKLNLNCFYEVDELEKVRKQRLKFKSSTKKDVKTQTIFRESSAQTSPWEPDYQVVQGDPELLLLDFLKWGLNLPAGSAEVDLIERMRKKRQMQVTLTSMKKGNIDDQLQMIEKFNRMEYAKRERDIEEIQAMRLELLEKMLNELHMKAKCRNEKKLRMFIDMKLKEKTEKLRKLEKETERQKRRLKFNFTGILSRYGKNDVYDEQADFKSEMYCPLMRNGANPRYRHSKLYSASKKYKAQYYEVEEYETLTRNLEEAKQIDEITLPGKSLCIRETKWTLPVLKQLYMDLKELRVTEVRHPNLRVCVQTETCLPPTPEIEASDSDSSPIDDSATFLQQILRGRAIQTKIYAGRARCKELIEELRGSTALLKGDECKKAKIRDRHREEQLNSNSRLSNMKALESSLKKLSGSVAGTLLDFLNKDLMRLHRERRIHAMLLLVERMRQLREAQEAGRRQKEIRRRLEHDEMFKQVVKVHQDTVDLYLQDVITEGMDFTSEKKANDYVEKLTAKIEDEQNQVQNEELQVDRQEYISNLVHNFVIPEVEKNIVRDKLKKQQRRFLQNAHDEIYNRMSTLTWSQALTSSTSTSEEQRTSCFIDQETLEKTQATERQTVLQDVQSILDDLITVPCKQSALAKLIPCSSSTETKEPSEKIEEESFTLHDIEDVEDEENEEEEEEEEDEIQEAASASRPLEIADEDEEAESDAEQN